MRRGKAREATDVLRAALRVRLKFPTLWPLDAHVSRATLYAQLAVAWDQAAEPDSAQAAEAMFRRLWSAEGSARPRIYVPGPAGAPDRGQVRPAAPRSE